MNTKKIEALVKILENSFITEIEITDFWGRKIKLSKIAGSQIEKNPPPQMVVQDTKKESAPVVENLVEQRAETPKKNLIAIRSPMVGTFFRAPAPDAAPYVEVGDIVKPGQVVCIVEAMKLMNEIESDVGGRIVEILVKNEEPVEYNQDLFLIEPL